MPNRDTANRWNIDDILRYTVEGTSSAVGRRFFDQIVKRLCEALGAKFSFIGELVQPDAIQTLAHWADEKPGTNFKRYLNNTPCYDVITNGTSVIGEKVVERFPADQLLKRLKIESYIGTPLKTAEGQVLGLLVLMDTKPFSDEQAHVAEQILKIFAARAAAEMERINADKKLSWANRELEIERSIFVTGPVVVFKWRNVPGRPPIEYVSANVLDVLGFSAAELISGQISYDTIIHTDDYLLVRQEVEKNSIGGVSSFQHSPYRINTKSGQTIWVDDFTTIVRDDAGKITHYLGYIVDITSNKLAEDALRESENRLQELYLATLEGLVIHDQGVVIEANQAILNLLGYQAEEVIGRNGLELVAPEARDAVMTRIETESSELYETIMLRKDGSTVPVEILGRPVIYQGKRVRVAAIRDITERRNAEKVMRYTVEGTSSAIGRQFLQKMVRCLSEALGVDYAFIGELIDPEKKEVKTLAVWAKGEEGENFIYDLSGTPCQNVVREKTCLFPENVTLEFPEDILLQEMGVASYVGTPLIVGDGSVLGLLVILDTKPLPVQQLNVARSILEIFAVRAAVELERIRADEKLRLANQKLNEERSALIGGPLVIFKWQKQPGWPVDYVSPNVKEVLGYTADEFISGKVLYKDIIASGDLKRLVKDSEKFDQRGVNTFQHEPYRLMKSDGTIIWVDEYTSIVRDEKNVVKEYIGHIVDITARIGTDQAMRRLNRALRVLSVCNEIMSRSRGEKELLEDICEEIVEGGGYALAWVAFAENDVNKTVRPAAKAGKDGSYLDSILISWSDNKSGQGPTGTAIRTGQPSIIKNIQDDPRFEQWRASALERGFKSSIAIPMIDGRIPFGALNIYASEPDAFDKEEVELLSRLASNLLYGVKAIRAQAERARVENELKILNEQLEERVKQRTVMLEASNKELESFAYSVSHDLRTPLRTIDGFSKAILEDYGDRLDNTGQDFLHRVIEGTHRMGELIDDILKLSRLIRSDMHLEKVDLSQMAKVIAAEIQNDESGRKAEISIQPYLEVIADKRLLKIALENLFSNAWKFTKRKEKTKIEFGANSQGEKVEYFIRDNGAGFDMAYADKLFGAFQRLHTQKEFPGSGIGLATVRRIIIRHGGSVRAEGEVGKGAIVYFSINDNLPESTNKNTGY